MLSRERITRAARQYGWETTRDLRHVMSFRRQNVEIVVQFRRNAGVLLAEFRDFERDAQDLISGGRDAVIDTLRMFGRK